MRRAERGGVVFRLMFLCVFIACLALLYLVRHPFLREIGSFWVIDDPLPHADAMIILSDDNFGGERAAHAAALYQQGIAPIVVPSNRLLRPFAEIGDMMSRDLQNHGVPPSAIVKSTPHRAADTREEAIALRSFVISKGWKRVIIVTSNYHTRRSKFIFDRIFPADVTIGMAAAPDSDYNPDNWWQMRSGLKMFLYETVGFTVAHWELRDVRSTHSESELLLCVLPGLLN